MNRILVYYENETGQALVIRTYGAAVEIPPDEQEQDYAAYPQLRNGEGIGRIFRHLTHEEQESGWHSLRVDITKTPHEIVFEEGGE